MRGGGINLTYMCFEIRSMRTDIRSFIVVYMLYLLFKSFNDLFFCNRQEIAKQIYGPDVYELLPKYDSIKTALERCRSSVLPKIPKTTDEIRLPDEWSKTIDGKNFVIADDGIGNDRIIVSIF